MDQFPVYQPPPPPSPKRGRRWLVVGLVVAAVIGVVAGVALAGPRPVSPGAQSASSASAASTSPPAVPVSSPAPSGPMSLSVGETLDITQNGTAAGTVTITSMSHTTQSSDGFESPEYGYFVIANVKITSTINGLNIDELDFYVTINGQQFQEGNGNSYDAAGFNENSDITTTLNAGEYVTGQLVYDLPAYHGQLVYAPNFDGAPLATWSF